MLIYKLLGSFGLILLSLNCSQAKEWRGIVPTQSERKDVIRILGQPSETNEVRSIYRLAELEAYIVFSSSEICSGSVNDRVLYLQVTPRNRILISELKIDEKFREFTPSPGNAEYRGYIDSEEGLIIRARNDQVDQMFYLATAKDKSFCSSFYEKQESLAQLTVDYLPVKFDSYSDLSKTDERLRLDNFALYLLKEPALYGYAVIFGPGSKQTRRASGQRIKTYLVKKHGVSAGRIIVLDGTKRSRPTVDLYALPEETMLPFRRISKLPMLYLTDWDKLVELSLAHAQ